MKGNSVGETRGILLYALCLMLLQRCICLELDAADNPKDIPEPTPKDNRSARRKLQAQLRERAKVELEHMRAAHAQARSDAEPPRQPGSSHATNVAACSEAEESPLALRPSSPRAASLSAGSTNANENPLLAHQGEITAIEGTVAPQGTGTKKRVVFGPKVHPLLAARRLSLGSDSSTDSSSSDDDAPTSPRIPVARSHTVQRKSCMKSDKNPGSLKKTNSQVDWVPVVDSAEYFDYAPTAVCILRDEYTTLELRAPSHD